MSFPATRELLEKDGYKRTNYGRCAGCLDSIEWWLTPNRKKIPMNFMENPDSPAVAHFATCKQVAKFKHYRAQK